MSARLRVIVADDERPARTFLTTALRSLDSVDIVGEAENGKDAIELIQREQPDVAFLDLQMPGFDGLSVVRALKKGHIPLIAFVTAHDQYAIQAFEYSAIHYLLKPIDSERLTQAIRRFTNADKIQKTNDRLESLIHNLEAHSSQDKKIAVPTTKGLNFYKLGEIVRFEGDGNYCSVVLTTGEELLVTKQLKYYEALLDKRLFFRTHQSHLVHLAFVERYMNSGNTFVKLTNQDEIPVSVRRRAEFFKLLAENQQI